jgi:hypothetical protein
MLIEFELTTSDYIQFSKEYLKKKSFMFKPYVFGIAVIAAVILTYTHGNKLFYNGIEVTNQTKVYVVSFVFTLGFLLGLIWIARSSAVNKYYRYYRKNKHLAGSRIITFSDNSLLFKRASNESEFQRESIKQIGETFNFIYLLLKTRQFLVIPKTSGVEFQTIKDWMKE